MSSTNEQPIEPELQPELRPQQQRRQQPDRGIIPIQAKGRIGPELWALFGKVDKPVILKDDLYLNSEDNEFYRDSQGRAFLLLPYVEESNPQRYQIADAAFRRAVALGICERPEVFFTCLYQYQLPEYRCIHVHADKSEDVLEENKCLLLMAFEKARLQSTMGTAQFTLERDKKIAPVTVHSTGKASNNLLFALNTLVLHHGYDQARVNHAWERAAIS